MIAQNVVRLVRLVYVYLAPFVEGQDLERTARQLFDSQSALIVQFVYEQIPLIKQWQALEVVSLDLGLTQIIVFFSVLFGQAAGLYPTLQHEIVKEADEECDG